MPHSWENEANVVVMSSDIDVVAHAALRHPRDEGHMTSCAELNKLKYICTTPCNAVVPS